MNKRRLFAFAVVLSFALGTWGAAASLAAPQATTPNTTPGGLGTVNNAYQAPPEDRFTPQGTVILPASSAGKGVHTNLKIFVPDGHGVSSAVPDFTFAETPASMGCVYKVGPIYVGCNPASGGTDHPTGGWGAIALVDAYDDPHAASDLAFFDSQWGLPVANFTKVYANSSFGTLGGGFGPTLTASCSGTPPPANLTGWDVEESLDIEWAHVMAPSARIILVEACSQNLEDLLFAEEVAGIEVSKYGGGDISNSWGYPEACAVDPSCNGGWSATEPADDNFFYRYYWQNITYFASAGDSGAEVLYPSASPWVVSAGGTTVNRDANENFLSESCWPGSGGGFSAYEFWQNPPSTILNGMGTWSDYQYELFGGYPYAFPARSTPDISFNADPNSGVYVYDTDEGGAWYIVGGTSVSSPSLAGIVNSSNNRLGQAPPAGGYYETHENNYIYDQLYAHNAYPANWYDVTTGSNGHPAGPGYDQCTGIGSPRGHLGK